MQTYSLLADSQSLRKALLPSRGNVVFWLGLVGCDHFLGGSSWWQAFEFVASYFFVSRALDAALFYVGARWPTFFESRGWVLGERVFWSLAVGAGVGYWLVFAGGGEELLAFRPDWGGALFVLAFGAILVVLWPLYRLFERCLNEF